VTVYFTTVRMGFGPLPTSYSLPSGVCFLGVKDKQREADHLS